MATQEAIQNVIARALCMDDNNALSAWPCMDCFGNAADVVASLVLAGVIQTDDGAAAPGQEPDEVSAEVLPEASEVAAGTAPSSHHPLIDVGAAAPPAERTAVRAAAAAVSATTTAAPTSPSPRRFLLIRYRDISGVSGTGPVAEGIAYSDGSVALRWYGDNPATAVWPSIESLLAVHGHQGATEIHWIDPDPPVDYWPVDPPDAPVAVVRLVESPLGLIPTSRPVDAEGGDTP